LYFKNDEDITKRVLQKEGRHQEIAKK
jgi:hypothetical protein